MEKRPLVLRSLCLTVGLAVLLTACSDSATADCDRVQREVLAASSDIHVLPTAEASYVPEPPTSGPHSAGPAAGSYVRALSAPQQIGILERGDVLVQYRPDEIGAEDLSTIAGPNVVVAENPALVSPIVLTAWRTIQQCSSFEPEAVRAFIEGNKNNVAGHS